MLAHQAATWLERASWPSAQTGFEARIQALIGTLAAVAACALLLLQRSLPQRLASHGWLPTAG